MKVKIIAFQGELKQVRITLTDRERKAIGTNPPYSVGTDNLVGWYKTDTGVSVAFELEKGEENNPT